MSFSHSIEELVETSTDDRHAAASWWERVLLGDVCNILNGYPFESKFFNNQHGAPLIRIRDVTSGISETKYNGDMPDGYWVEPGDLIVGMDGDFNTRIWNSDRGLLNQRVCKLIPKNEYISLDFIYYLLPGYLDLINKHTHSITVKHLSSRTIQQIPVPLPSRREQDRIVAKLDSLFARSKAARVELARIPLLIEHYKQAILEKAFTGELTADWRRATLGDSSKADWHLTTIGKVATVASGQTPKGIEAALSSDGNVPWFKVSSMNDVRNRERMIESEFRLTEESVKTLGLHLYPPDAIIFPKRGGAIATNKKRRLATFAALDLNLMCLVPSNVEAEFLWWWMNTIDLSSISNGSNVPQINHGDISPLKIEVPSREEQKEISRLLSESWKWLDVVSAEQMKAAHLLDHLDQGLLARAFRGELVPQDPDDEPAEMLLERIRAARADQPKIRRGRRASAGAAA